MPFNPGIAVFILQEFDAYSQTFCLADFVQCAQKSTVKFSITSSFSP